MQVRNNTNELQHHGILGQKWGVRRFQNKDGTLTPRGKKRAEKLKKEYLNLVGKKQVRKNNQSNESEKPKQISEMSDAELQKIINRKRLEQQYAQLTPKQVSVGKRFVDKVLAPAAADASKKALSAYMEKQFKTALKVPNNQNNNNNNKKKDK